MTLSAIQAVRTDEAPAPGTPEPVARASLDVTSLHWQQAGRTSRVARTRFTSLPRLVPLAE